MTTPEEATSDLEAIETFTSELESIAMPAVNVLINVDVNDLMATMSIEEVFELLGKIKDLIEA